MTTFDVEKMHDIMTTEVALSRVISSLLNNSELLRTLLRGFGLNVPNDVYIGQSMILSHGGYLTNTVLIKIGSTTYKIDIGHDDVQVVEP